MVSSHVLCLEKWGYFKTGPGPSPFIVDHLLSRLLNPGASLVVQWLRLCLPLQRVWVQSLVRELGSHVPHGLGARAWSRGDIVVNSVETLKRWSTSKEKKKDCFIWFWTQQLIIWAFVWKVQTYKDYFFQMYIKFLNNSIKWSYNYWHHFTCDKID